MSDLQRALEIAVEAHKGQVQKNGLPYVLHPLTLMLSVQSAEAKMAAVLHDVVEDSDWTMDDLRGEGFSTAVIDALDCLTHRGGESYDDYIERIAINTIARDVKLSDLEDNMNILRIHDLKQKDLDRLQKYHTAWFRLSSTPV